MLHVTATAPATVRPADDMKSANIVIVAAIVLAVSGLGFLQLMPSASSDDSSRFAQCLTDSGAVMYGTDWCKYCQQQKELFGQSFSQVNYKNCDLDRAACDQAGVTGYPTWVINGQSYVGVQSLEKLASVTGCSI